MQTENSGNKSYNEEGECLNTLISSLARRPTTIQNQK